MSGGGSTFGRSIRQAQGLRGSRSLCGWLVTRQTHHVTERIMCHQIVDSSLQLLRARLHLCHQPVDLGAGTDRLQLLGAQEEAPRHAAGWLVDGSVG
jgi:hypothetical protein